MQPGVPYPIGRPPSAGSAETLILVALILQLIFIIIGALAVGLVGVFLLGAVVSFAFWFFVIVAVVFVVGAIFLWCGYEFSYQRVRAGNLEGARTPTLILGILGILFGGLIPGILYLVAYAKIGDAMNEMMRYQAGWYGPASNPYYAAAPPYGSPGPVAMPPGTPMAPPAPGPGVPGGVVMVPQCPRCGRPTQPVPQYGRYWCPYCAQYL